MYYRVYYISSGGQWRGGEGSYSGMRLDLPLAIGPNGKKLSCQGWPTVQASHTILGYNVSPPPIIFAEYSQEFLEAN